MIRFLLVLVVVMGGCIASIPSDDALTADMACEAARMVTQLRKAPAPDPKPEPDGECCKQCKGTGTITHGDGHKTPCPCPPTCKCKKPKATAVLSYCPDGRCPQ